ncbi:MAG: 5'/3'-nucleotidase SurE [Myxococcota bacterium]|nr:5'/3'-nucleotidase SurE [Myxococcota bacterium]
MTARHTVIVSNDDGIGAPGILALEGLLDEWADCIVIAPDGPRSGIGHALSDASELRIDRIATNRMAVSGTPADCARLALAPGSPLGALSEHARRDRDCWLVSGINHGANLGVDTYVSGTAAAAREAAILGFPAIAVSQYVGRHREVDWDRAVRMTRPILEQLLARPPAPGAFWNVNLPHPLRENPGTPVVFCEPDPSPHPIRYEKSGEAFRYSGDYHARPRLKGHDVDVCLGGAIAVSEVHLFGSVVDSGVPERD